MKLIKKEYKNKELIIFDLDGTLAKSKLEADTEMLSLLISLLSKKKVAIIGGGKYGLFQMQILNNLKTSPRILENLFIFPTNSTAFYKYDKNQWRKMYEHNLSPEERKKIANAFYKSFPKVGYSKPKNVYGEIVEDRGTQITFSAHGQKAPLEVKEEWNKKNDVRPKLIRILKNELPEFSVRSGGLTSVDITRKGIDKAYGVRQIKKILGITINKMLFVGDALYPGGNDAAAKKTGIDCFQVMNPEETKKLIRFFIK